MIVRNLTPMQKTLLFVLVATGLGGCATYMPIEGKYHTGPVETTTAKSKDEIWENLMDLVARNGLPVVTLDKASGILIVGPTSLTATRERGRFDRNRSKTDARLVRPNAHLVTGYVYGGGQFTYDPNALGRWNVRVRDNGENRLVSVVLFDLKAADVPPPVIRQREQQEAKARFQSTGNFEQMIVDAVTR